MAESTVTHDQLQRGQNAILDRLTVHEAHFHDVSTRLFEKVDKTIDACHDNSLQIATVQASVTAMAEGRAGHLARLESTEASIRTLEKSEAFKAGERGVLAAILRSPFIAWLAAFGAVVWAGLKGLSHAATP